MTKAERELAEKSKRILTKALQRPSRELFDSMIRSGIIDKKGRVQMNGSRSTRKKQRPT